GGPVTAGTRVTLRLRTAPGDLTSARVRLWNSTSETESFVDMSPSGPDTWEAVIDTSGDPAALWYRFQGLDGRITAYYNDDRERDGGPGEGNLYASDQDYVITAYDPDFTTPEWLHGGVVYQIFPDRFNNGDPTNDKPAGTFMYGGESIKREWGERPTGGNDFFGGDLQGVIDRLEYLQSLGVNAIYFNPIFAAPSNHRYDTTDYTRIEPSLGTLDTFRDLIARARERGIRVVLDGVFNHSSSDSLYFDRYSRYDTQGAYESQESPYLEWYTFQEWPNKYRSWFNVDTLPVFSEVQAVRDFFFFGQDAILKRWMREDIGGWRLDAAEQKSHSYWRDLRVAGKAEDSEAVIIGEFWQNSAPWLAGDQWDGTMNYRFRDAVLGWLANPVRSVEMMARKLDSIREDYPPQALAVSMNLVGSHDTQRALTEARGDKNMLRLMALMQFTWPGLPTVYYGDEVGLEGGRDPDDRRTYPWGQEDTSLLEFYRMLAETRQHVPAIRTGDYANLRFDNDLDVYAYARTAGDSAAVVVLNRSKEDRAVELPVKDVLAAGVQLTDRMNAGNEYTIEGDTITVKVPARWGALLVTD
ncbi:MAG TPA: glycoside hydrolase family 13 protein, partial [Chloroflexia bacterium]|nr:glycoside hydrolase family 13 protein [Chloroflexia bacterium]